MPDPVDLHDVQARELGILKLINQICSRHHITYYLAYGTLIGAIRHQGFIPWDDDVDIIMTREEYERFFAVRDELGLDYLVQDWRTTPDFWSFHPKVRQVRPKPYLESTLTGTTENNGLFVDIFLLDYLPRPASVAQTLMTTLLYATRLVLSAKQYGRRDPRPLIRGLSRVAQLVPKSWLAAVMLWGSTRWNQGPHKWVVSYGGMIGTDPQVAPVTAYGEPIWRRFEDTDLPCPPAYDRLLRNLYGDYLQLPPEDQRVSHGFVRNPNAADE